MTKKNIKDIQPRTKTPQRRWLKRILLTALAIILVPILTLATYLFLKYQNELTNTAGKVTFSTALPIPRLAESTVSADGTRTFDLSLKTGKTEFFPGTQTETWGINGNYLGPTLRAKNGEKVQFKISNDLPQTTSVHWHGMHVPAKMDGGPHQSIKSGETWEPNWTIKQPAATLWYHPHPHGLSEKHIYRGLAGMFILDDDNPAALQLPHVYGKDDIPVIVQDKEFTKDKQLDEGPGSAATGKIGKEIIVNGARTPFLAVSTEKIRLRLLNGSAARIYNFGMSDDREMQVIASDGGLLEQLTSVKRLVLSPGERAEVIITMRPDEKVTLRSYPMEMKSGLLNNRTFGGDDTLDILQLRALPMLESSPAIPSKLAVIEKLDPAKAAATRQFVLDGSKKINDKSMDMNRVDLAVTKGTSEIWEVTNEAQMPHNFHVHDVQFQIISIDGSPPPLELAGYKDTVRIFPGQTIRIIMEFTDYADATWPYMYHCHLLRHEDDGMMGQFVVIEPGQVAPSRLKGSMDDMQHHAH